MTKFSKTSIQKLKLHIKKLDNLKNLKAQSTVPFKTSNLIHLSTSVKNQSLSKVILIKSILLNNSNFSTLKSKTNKSLPQIYLLKTQLLSNDFQDENEKSYLLMNNHSETSYFITQRLLRLVNYFKAKYKKTRFNLFEKNNFNQKITLKNIINKIERIYLFIKHTIFNNWYIYLSRLFVVTLIHFIPFIQLITALIYNQSNRQVVHPLFTSFLNFIPFIVSILNITSPILNQDTISFLILVPYLYFFIYSFRKYNIPRKIAYQGSFALALMLFRYSLLLSQEALSVVFKFTKRFFFLKKYKNIELLRDDIKFYVDDLEELRTYREEFLQLGESIFSLEDVTNITRIWESTSILCLLAVVALFYNYMYFIFRGKKPIIPIVTTTVQRMMIDRNSKEP